MLKNKNIYLFFFSLFVFCNSKAQVWYPEGNYNVGPASAITSDISSIYVVSKIYVSANESVWQASKWDGKFWLKFPLLKLNKDAEVVALKVYQTSLYLVGNFTFANDSFNAAVRFKAGRWEGVAKFLKANAFFGNISAVNIYENKLLFGGNFNKAGSDSIPFLVAYNGFNFSFALQNCKTCMPNNIVNDIAVSDSAVAISGSFTKIAGHTSKYLYLLKEGKDLDTFLTLPKPIEKLVLNSKKVYGSFDVLGYKRIFKYDGKYLEIMNNLDSIRRISKLVWYDNNIWACGSFKINGVLNIEHQIIQLENNTWNNYTNNYKRAYNIFEVRGLLWALGNANEPISLLRDNRFVMRFYKNFTLVKAKVFIDSNNNCIQERNEKGIGKQFVKLAPLNRGAITLENGLTEFLLPNNQSTYKFEIKPLRNYIKSNCADTTVSKTIPLGRYLDILQFPLTRRPNINDIRIILSSTKGEQVIKRKKINYIVKIINVGSNTLNGVVKLKVNTKLSGDKILPIPTEYKDSTYSWIYLNLKPYEERYFNYSGYPNDTFFEPNTQFSAMASSSIIGGNNGYNDDDVDSISQSVVNALNPFKKYTSPAPLPSDSVSYLSFNNRQIRYDIVFNNFTTDTVYNAVISDTLDLNLDMSYIQETGSNKPYYTEIQTDPNNNYRGILIWHFNNIKLPPNPSKNFENLASSSYIGFKVVMKPTSTGNLIKNTAAVFFDNQYVGKTNIAYCTVLSTGVKEIISNEMAQDNIYPNPTTGIVYFKNTFYEGEIIKIYNLQGQVIYTEIIKEYTINHCINLTNLSAGFYTIQYYNSKKISTQKLIKE